MESKKAAEEFVKKVAKSARKMSQRQANHICKLLADHYPSSNDVIASHFDKDILKDLPQMQIDGKLQNERARLRQFLGESRNAGAPVCTLAEIRVAWADYSSTPDPSPAPMYPKNDSSEYSLFMDRVKRYSGEEKASKLDDAFKTGGHALKKSDDPESSFPEGSSVILPSLPVLDMNTQPLSSLPAQHQPTSLPTASSADFELFRQFMAFKNTPQPTSNQPSAPSTPSISAPTSPMKGDVQSDGSRDSSPVQTRPAKIAKIGEVDSDASVELSSAFSSVYDPQSIDQFDLKWYGGVISVEARGHVLLVDRSAQEVVVTLGCPWWCQLVVTVDSNEPKPAIIVNVVPDDQGLFEILTKVDPELVTAATWKVRVTKPNMMVPQRPFSFSIPIPKRVINRREIKTQNMTIGESFRITRVHMPFKQ